METRQEKEIRLAAEYAAYVAAAKEKGELVLNYMNWAACQKAGGNGGS